MLRRVRQATWNASNPPSLVEMVVRRLSKLAYPGRAGNHASTFRLLSIQTPMLTLTLKDFEDVRARIAPHIKHTPLLTSRQLSELTGYDVRMKAEMFQRVGSYKIRGPLNKFALIPEDHHG